jgi:hypothetical protein
LPQVALSVLGKRDAQKLELAQTGVNYRKLRSFLKNIFVCVDPTGGVPNSRSPKKLIHDLVLYAGKYTFDKNGVETTVKV